MLVADIPPVPTQETPVAWVQAALRSGKGGARLDGARNEVTCGAMPVGYCALRGLMVADAGNTTVLATASDALLLADAASKTITPEIVRKVNKALANSCTEAESLRFVEGRKAFPGGLSPSAAVVIALYDYGIKVTGVVKAVITQQPAHGRVTMVGLATQSFPGLSLEEFEYTPDKDFLGDDKVAFEVTVNGQKFRINFVVKVIHPGGWNDSCEPSGEGSALTPEVQVAIEDMQYLQDANAPEVATSWQSLFAQDEQVINSINLSFADLPNNALGQTTGPTITLDTNAAGYGWFIDQTPGTNEEYLPTSNPNEWIAKAGSEAAGKMDLLSVLLHEYGHALGIEHSADSNDYMAATLQPGVRRLPSSDELALMAKLVGEIKAAQDSPNTPLNPSLPIGTTLSALLVGRLRRTDYGSWSPVFNSMQIAAPAPQFEIAANPKLQNPDFDGGTDWTTEGAVAFSNGAATFNLQANGSEHKAAVITRIDNPDGSHTYLVDLAGIPAGTTVNLAFDLIGFGLGAEASNSQITVRDLRLGVPQTTDDSASLAEDTPTVIDALTNDLNARQPGFAPVVVGGPAHGQVAVNAPSTGSGQASFSFTPEQRYQ